MKYFTSDLHLNHKRIIENRKNAPYTDDINKFNSWLIERIYDIPSGSDLYILGDIAWDKGTFVHFLNKKPKNIQLHIILGNHDERVGHIDRYFGINSVSLYKTVKDLGHKFFLCHYPLKVWDCSHYNSINLYGHIHLDTPNIAQEGRQLNVNCEFWDYKPVSSQEIIDKLDGVDNWDYLEVKRRKEYDKQGKV